MFDETSFAKFDVTGAGALAFLEWICANDLDVEPGRVVYTPMLNDRGGIEADVTVTRLGAERFRIITGTGSGSRDLAWLRRHGRAASSIEIHDVTSSLACLGIWGPASRDVLTSVCHDDLSPKDSRT